MNGPWWRVLSRCALGAAIVINVTKSLPIELQVVGWAQYQITYAFGFVRRGLVGTIYQYFAEGISDGDKQRQVLGLHVLVVAVVVAALLAWLWALAKRAPAATRQLLVAGGAAFLLAPAIPTFLNLAGYLDIYLAGFALLGMWAFRRRKIAYVLLAGVLGPFVHDAFVYWWLSVVALALVETSTEPLRARARRLAVLAPPLVLFPLIMALHTPEAVVKLADIAGGGDWGKAESLRLMFNIKLGSALPMMGRMFRDNPENVVISALYALPICGWLGLCAIRALPPAYRRWSNALLVLAATFAPSLVLSVGWDLSRLLSWSAVSGAMALAWSTDFTAERDPASEPAVLPLRWDIVAAVVFATNAVFATAPLFFTYFHVAFPTTTFIPRALIRYSPAAWLEAAVTVEYNRKLMPRRVDLAEKCDPGRFSAEKIAGEPCAWHIDRAGALELNNLRLVPGHYRAYVALRVPVTCERAVGTIDVLSWWRYVETTESLPYELRGDGQRHDFELPFTMTRESAAFGADILVTRLASGCVDIVGMRLERE